MLYRQPCITTVGNLAFSKQCLLLESCVGYVNPLPTFVQTTNDLDINLSQVHRYTAVTLFMPEKSNIKSSYNELERITSEKLQVQCFIIHFSQRDTH